MSGAQDPHVVLLAVRISGDQGETFAAPASRQGTVEIVLGRSGGRQRAPL